MTSTASSGAITGYGAKVRVGVGVTPTWTQLTGIQNFQFPDQTPDTYDATHLNSPNNTMESVRGMFKEADWTLTMHYVPGSDQDGVLMGIWRSGETVQVELTPAGTGAAARVFSGYLVSYRPTTIDPKGVQLCEARFRVGAEIIA